MNLPGKFVNEYDWTVCQTNDTDKEKVQRRYVPKLDKSDPAPCDNCGDKVMALNACNRELSLGGLGRYSYDFYCDECVEGELQ